MYSLPSVPLFVLDFLHFIHEEWKEIQQQHYKTLGMTNTGKRWATELIKKLWAISWDLLHGKDFAPVVM